MRDGLDAGSWSWAVIEPSSMANHAFSLADAAADLEASWRGHVERAEGWCGLHAFVCAASPRHLPIVRHLRARERTILAELEHLAFVATGSSGSVGWLRSEYARLVQEIVRHDELETDILYDALERSP